MSDDYTDREKRYEKAMADAVMPGLLEMMTEQMRRFHAAAMPFATAHKSEPKWMGAVDIATSRIDMLSRAAKKVLWDEQKKANG